MRALTDEARKSGKHTDGCGYRRVVTNVAFVLPAPGLLSNHEFISERFLLAVGALRSSPGEVAPQK